jgi:hypothetical protein
MKTIKVKSKWKEFYEAHPDPSPFTQICSLNTSLLKIFNFCHVNNILLTDNQIGTDENCYIHKNLKQYPFEEKAKELDTITHQDIDHLNGMRMRSGNESEWFDYLHDLFSVTERTIRIRQIFSKINENKQLHQKLSPSEINEELESIFCNHLSLDLTLIVIDSNGNKKNIRRIGRYFPVMGIEFHEVYNSKTAGKEIGLHIYFPKDLEGKAIIEKINWDNYSVTSFKTYLNIPWIEGLCFESKPSDHVTIQYYQHGKPILDKPFEFQTVKRYDPLLKAQVKKLNKHKALVKDIVGTKDPNNDLYTEVVARLFESMLTYDARNYSNPGSYFKGCLENWGNELYEKHSTEKGDRFCDLFCKKNKENSNELPCQYETQEGYCIDPKKKLKLKSEIEHSGGSLDDEFINPESEGDTRRVDLIEDKVTPNPELVLIPDEKEAIITEAYKDARLLKIINMNGRRSSADQKYYERKIAELKEKLKTK